MYCRKCKRPVPGIRNGHAVRNTAGVLGAVPTLGLSLLATKSEGWHCPNCGGRATKAGQSLKMEWVSALVAFQFMMGIAIGAAMHSFVGFLVVLIVPWVIYFLARRIR